MNRPARAMIGIGLPMLAIVVFFVLLAFSLLRLADMERSMRIEASPNMLWVISRAHVASLRLGYAVNRHAIDGVDSAELAQRYNVFLSRLHLLDGGPQQRRIEAMGFADELAGFNRLVPELASRIQAIQPYDLQAARQINALLLPYNAMLGRAANKAMVAEWNILGNILDTTRSQLFQIIILLIGIFLAGAVLTLHFVLSIREARLHTRLLNQEKAFSQLLIGSSGEGIVAVDRDRQCTVWNGAAEHLFGLKAGAVIGRPLGQVSGFFQIDRMERAIDRTLRGEPAMLLDQPYFFDDHEVPLYIDLRCFPLRDGERIIGSILLVFDVTERRAAQQELTMHRDHLEQMVNERTQELDAALERERATAELYRNFGAMISHQFRTPLAIVDSALQRLIRRGGRLSTAEIRQRGNKARRAIARMVELIESTLDAARLDAGQIESRSQPCELGELAVRLCEQQREATAGRQIVLFPPPPPAPIVHCDPAHVEHILANLLSNAVKYSTADTTVTVTVRAAEGHAECAISNRGAIATEAERNALFERYYRGKNAEGHAGIGIGLYMARSLARMQGGDVVLDDQGKGEVTFTLRLPLTCPIGDTALLQAPA